MESLEPKTAVSVRFPVQQIETLVPTPHNQTHKPNPDLMAHIVDTALEKRFAEGNPVRVGLVGAGFMAKGLVLQIEKVRTDVTTTVTCC